MQKCWLRPLRLPVQYCNYYFLNYYQNIVTYNIGQTNKSIMCVCLHPTWKQAVVVCG